MKRFLCRISVFLLVFVTICSIPFYIFEKKAKECTDVDPYSSINNVSNMEHVDADLIILGNCRAERGYDASLMTSLSGLQCLNLGWAGSSFDYSYYIMYKTYLKHNKKPRYIIVETSPLVFFNHEHPVYNLQMLPYINRPEFYFYIKMCPQLSNADKIMFVRYFGKLGKVIKEIDRLNHPETNRIEENNKGWRDDIFGKPLRMEYDKSIIRLFDKFLDSCLSDGIKVILVCSPMHVKDALSYMDINRFWSIVMKCVSGTGFPVISYADYFGNDTAFFSDPAHLNNYGRVVFSTKLIHDLDSVGIIKSNK